MPECVCRDNAQAFVLYVILSGIPLSSGRLLCRALGRAASLLCITPIQPLSIRFSSRRGTAHTLPLFREPVAHFRNRDFGWMTPLIPRLSDQRCLRGLGVECAVEDIQDEPNLTQGEPFRNMPKTPSSHP